METRLSLAERSLLSALTTVPPGVGLSHVQTAYAVIQREAQRQADAVRILATLLPLAETVAGNDPSKEAIEQFWEAANAARAFLGADATKAGKRRRTVPVHLALKAAEEALAEGHLMCGEGDDNIYAHPLRLVRKALADMART